MKKNVATITCALAAVFTMGTAHSQNVNLRMAGLFPASHPMVSQGEMVFIDEVKKLTDGKVSIKYFPTEQLGKAKDMPDALKNGMVDISGVAPAYSSEKIPLSGVGELPGMFEKVCDGVSALGELVQPGELIYEQELKPNGMRVLFVMMNDTYKIMATNKDKLKNIGAMKGQKIRTAGGSMDLVARSLDMSPVRMTGPETLVALQRGTLDGLLWPILSVKPWGVDAPLNGWVSNTSVGSFVYYAAISEKTWAKLDEEAQNALTEAGKVASQSACQYMDSNIEPEIEKLKEADMEPINLSDEDVKTIVGKFETIHGQWADTLDKQGKPGSDVLKAFKSNLN